MQTQTASSAERQLVTVCAGTPWDGAPMSEIHIARQLAKYCNVLFVDPPTSVMHAKRRSFRGYVPEPVDSFIWRLTPIVAPFSRRTPMLAVTAWLARHAIRNGRSHVPGAPLARVLASDLPLFQHDSGERRVLFATDDFQAGADLMGLSQAQVIANERRLAQQSDLVISVSETLAAKWNALGCETVVIPNGCDTERFAAIDDLPWPSDVRLKPPIAGFAGQINDRIDLQLLERLADKGHSVLLVGALSRTYSVAKLDALLARSNVQWLGAKPFDQMPVYMRAIHVGLTPYADTAFNRASFPLKTLEYLAAGRAVVATDLPAARQLAGPHVDLCRTADEFVTLVEARLKQPLEQQFRDSRRSMAASQNWNVRGRQFATAIGVSTHQSHPGSGRQEK